MGGSLGLALRGRCALLLGVDPDPQTLALARRWRVADQVTADPAEVLPQADLIVLAAPVRGILAGIQQLSNWTSHPAVVVDLGSTKMQITAAMGLLPERFDPIGGHPMCGKEKSSLANADAALFQGAAFALTPLERTSLRARQMATQMVEAVGARPVWLDPQTHDRWTSATSHFPYLVSSALAQATPEEVKPLVGPGFRSSARLAGSSPGMMIDILRSNRSNVLERLKDYRLHLEQIEALLEQQNYDMLEALLADGVERYQILIGGSS
jgi:prephenate dehydrogenase